MPVSQEALPASVDSPGVGSGPVLPLIRKRNASAYLPAMRLLRKMPER